MSNIHTYMNPNAKVGDYYFDSQKNCYMIYDGKVWIPMSTPGAVPSPYYTNTTAGSPYSLTIGNSKPVNMFQVNLSDGRQIRANLETGEVFFPQDMNRSDALNEFWKGFSNAFMPNNSFKAEVVRLKKQIRDYEEYAVKEVTNKIAEKIQKKYGKEKFIMLKPDDLINFIKGD